MVSTWDAALPIVDNDKMHADHFVDYFIGKVASFRNKLSEGQDEDDVLWADIKFDGEPLVTLAPVTSDEVKKIIMHAATKSCELAQFQRFF